MGNKTQAPDPLRTLGSRHVGILMTRAYIESEVVGRTLNGAWLSCHTWQLMTMAACLRRFNSEPPPLLATLARETVPMPVKRGKDQPLTFRFPCCGVDVRGNENVQEAERSSADSGTPPDRGDREFSGPIPHSTHAHTCNTCLPGGCIAGAPRDLSVPANLLRIRDWIHRKVRHIERGDSVNPSHCLLPPPERRT